MFMIKRTILLVFIVTLYSNCSSDSNIEMEQPSNEQIEREPKIANLSTNSADFGDVVIINGADLSDDDQYVVKLDDMQLTVSEVLPTEIKFEVPENALSGIVTVTFNGKTIAVGELIIDIIVNGISKNYVETGEEVSILGKNFSDKIEYEIIIDGMAAVINSIASNEILFVVPQDISTSEVTLSFLNRNESVGNLVIAKIYDGDVILSTQEEVDDFGNSGYTEITGFLVIGSLETNSTFIGNVNKLSDLRSVGRGIDIVRNQALLNLHGLENLTFVGEWFQVYDCNSLTSLEGLSISSNLSSLWISNNYFLEDLKGLDKIGTVLGRLMIWGNNNLRDLSELTNITEVTGDLVVRENTSLVDLSGLENIMTIGGKLQIYETSLQSLSGLEKVETIGGMLDIDRNLSLTSILSLQNVTTMGEQLRISGNSSLPSLTGLENLETIATGGLGIIGNAVLRDFCALTKLFENPFEDYFEIISNSYNPTQEDLINGFCNL